MISSHALRLGSTPCRMGHCPILKTKTTLENPHLFLLLREADAPLLQFFAPQASALEMHQHRPLRLLAVGNQRFKSLKVNDF